MMAYKYYRWFMAGSWFMVGLVKFRFGLRLVYITQTIFRVRIHF